MRKILLLALASGFIFTSCKKDDDNDQSLIVGTWKIDKYFYKYADGTSETELPDACDTKTRITFKEDGSIINDEFSTDVNNSCVSYYETGNYSYNESSKTLKINLDNEITDFKVVTLSNSELAIQTENDDYDGDGVNDIYIGYLKR